MIKSFEQFIVGCGAYDITAWSREKIFSFRETIPYGTIIFYQVRYQLIR